MFSADTFDVHDIPVIMPSPITEACILETSDRFDLPPLLLKTILAVEGGDLGTISENTNDTYDLGPMQINTLWIEKFAPYVSPSEILYNGCVNLQVGAWILRSKINQANGDFWTGVGNYHSGTPGLHENYQQKVYAMSQDLMTQED